MKRIKILNKRIEKYFQKKNDQDLMTKLKTIKPVVNIKCPESYIFYKTQFLSYQTEPRKTQKLAVVNINKRIKLNTKLIIKAKNKKPVLNILSLSNSNSNNKNNFMKSLLNGRSFYENSKLFDDNLNLSKRIKEKSSYYSLSQWKKDFKKSRIYKKISCEYPSINFTGKPKKKINKNHEMSPRHNINIFQDIKFIPFTSFSCDKKRNKSNSRERDKNSVLDKIKRYKYSKIIEDNKKLIFDNNYIKTKK